MDLNHQEAFIAFFNRHPEYVIPDDINDDDWMGLGYGDAMDRPSQVPLSLLSSVEDRVRYRIGARLAFAYKKGRRFGGSVWGEVLAGLQPLWEGGSEQYAIYLTFIDDRRMYVAWDHADPTRARGDAMAAPFPTFHQALDYIEPFEQHAVVELAESDPSLIKEDLRNAGRDEVVLVWGTPTDGFNIAGPFTPNDPDLEHAIDQHLHADNSYWWYAPLITAADFIAGVF